MCMSALPAYEPQEDLWISCNELLTTESYCVGAGNWILVPWKNKYSWAISPVHVVKIWEKAYFTSLDSNNFNRVYPWIWLC